MAVSSNLRGPNSYRGAHLGPLPTGTSAAFPIAVLAIVLVASLAYKALASSAQSARRVSHILQVLEPIADPALSTLQGVSMQLHRRLCGRRGCPVGPLTSLAPALRASLFIVLHLPRER